MKFVHPEILYALGALSIPVIVHLFIFRRFKKVLFSNVEFLKEIKQETQSKSKLKHLLILLARLLAMACIIFAFAQPYIPKNEVGIKQGDKAVSIYIDNSFSMEGESEGGPLLEIAKNKAIEIVNAYRPTDKFQLLTNDFEGRHQRLVSKEEIVDLIQEVRPSSEAKKVSEVFSRQRDLLNASGFDNKTSFILSDLQASVTDIDQLMNDSTIDIRMIPTLASKEGNLYIDSVWFSTPVRQLNQAEILNVKLVNTGSTSKENVPIELKINGQAKSVATINVGENTSVVAELNYSNTESGFKNCVVSIDDYPIVFDDSYFFSYNVKGQISIADIKSSTLTVDPIATVFSDDPYFVFTPMGENAVDYGKFASQDMIVLNQLPTLSSGLISEIEKFVGNGGSVCLIPSSESNLTSYNDFLGRMEIGQFQAKSSEGTKVSTVNYEHPIYKNAFEKTTGNIDLPSVRAWYPLSVSQRNLSQVLLGMQNGFPMLIASPFREGNVYVSTVSLMPEESDFTRHAFFPTSFLRFAEFSEPSSQLSYTLGNEQVIALRNVSLTGEETFKLRNVLSGEEVIPEHRSAGGNTELFIHSDLHNAGNYLLSTGDSTVAAIGFNFNRVESLTKTLSVDEVSELAASKGFSNLSVIESGLEAVGKLASELDEGKKYWWTMVIWALIFLATEVLLIKFWR